MLDDQSCGLTCLFGKNRLQHRAVVAADPINGKGVRRSNADLVLRFRFQPGIPKSARVNCGGHQVTELLPSAAPGVALQRLPDDGEFYAWVEDGVLGALVAGWATQGAEFLRTRSSPFRVPGALLSRT